MWNNQLSHLSQFKEIIWKNYSYHSCKECYLQNWDGHKTYSRSFLTLIKSFNENLPSIILLDRWSEMAPLVNYNSQLFPGRKKGETMEGVISDIHHLSLLSDPTQISISSQFFILTITLSLCVGDFTASWEDSARNKVKQIKSHFLITFYCYFYIVRGGFTGVLFFNLSQNRSNIRITFTFTLVTRRSLFGVSTLYYHWPRFSTSNPIIPINAINLCV